jgi:hypothetical protein
MSPTHPLELAEILMLVVPHLPLRSLPVCARVSRTWYQVCVPLIWNDIYLNMAPESTALIQRHSHLVKKVRAGRMSRRCTALRFENLDSLELDTECVEDIYTRFVMGHPTVTRLALRYFHPGCPSAFWDALLGFHNLRTLSMSSLEIFGPNIDKFWQLCRLLERLDISMLHDSELNVIVPQEKFPSIKHLGVEARGASNVPFFMEFLRRCPSLTFIRWQSVRYHEQAFLAGLSVLSEANTLPYLEHLDVKVREIPNSLVAKVIQSMPRITTLTLSMSDYVCEMDFATPLQSHFTNIRVLELFPESRVKSRMAQDILSSCPLLEKLVAPHVDADVVTEGKPWVCLGLKVLELALCFDPPSTIRTLQPLVFDQLSKLTQLESWCIAGPSDFAGTVDLRIECGLDKLSTLRRLHSVVVYDIAERMGDAEVDWMLEHWKRLKVFSGKLNTLDDTVGKMLRERMWDHGIASDPVLSRDVRDDIGKASSTDAF